MRNWMVAVIALGLGGAVSVALLFFANPSRAEVAVYALARDVPAGAPVTRDSLRLETVAVSDGVSSLFMRGDEVHFEGLQAGHDLTAGQLLQRSDLLPPGSAADERLVFIPVKDAPPAAPGSTVDLLLVTGTPDSPAIIPFALGVQIRAVVAGGFIVAVPSKQASAFVYAAEAMRLVAVIAGPGSAGGSETPISAPDQAIAVAGRQ